MNWSKEQEAIFNWFENPEPLTATIGDQLFFKEEPVRHARNLQVVARAGCGKTTTIIEGVRRAPEKRKLVAAFNARIAEELTKRCPPGVVAKTLHSVGYSLVLRNWEGVKIDKSGDRARNLTEKACGAKVPDAIKRLVTRLHTLARETMPMAETGEELRDLAERFECVPDEMWEESGYTVEHVCSFAASAMFHAANERPATGIDFSDMIFLPIRNGWLVHLFDLVVIDETQDMTPAQLTIARGVCKGRLCIVGDNRQAIYSFRGAATNGMDRLRDELDAQVLGLKTTYRCGRAVVDHAARLVPDFQAGPANPEGFVGVLHTSNLTGLAGPGDFILSRINAPLVSTAIKLLREGKRTRVAGREIGKDLTRLVQRLSKSARSVPAFLERVEGWVERETARALKLKNPDPHIELINDRAEMLREIADQAKNVEEISTRIEYLFTDDGLGDAGMITCSSVHKAKGLEAKRVFVLADTLRADNEEELNIQYVAFTRAKESLVLVSDQVSGQGLRPLQVSEAVA